MNELTNENTYPFCSSIACQTGWLDFSSDCMGEALTTYSDNKGFVGFLGCSRSTWAISGTYYPTPPKDLQARIPYMIWNDLSHIAGEFILEAKLNSSVASDPFSFNLFGDPALNIMAKGFEITHDVVLSANTTITNEIRVRNGAELLIPQYGHLLFSGEGKLIIEEGARLLVYSQATITGTSADQVIQVDGDIMIYGHPTFNSAEGTVWKGLRLNNMSNELILWSASFENCKISGEYKKLTLINCSFENSGIKFSKGDIIIQDTEFDNSKIDIANGDSKSSFVEIKAESVIQNCQDEPAIHIDGYYNFTIDDCIITGNDGDAIGIFNSGGALSTNEIKNNVITNNGWDDLGAAIKIYHSYADIYGDQLIEGNKYGIICLNNSNVSVCGNKSANYVYETQTIRNNKKYQLYASYNSFPFNFKWNAVIDEDNLYPLVCYSASPISQEENLDVSNNYWGNNFAPSEDLYPAAIYTYLPIWQLSSGEIEDEAELSYSAAQNLISQENYTAAKTELQEIITDYPNSTFAQAALRDLFSLEEYVSNDYSSLQSYYTTESNIQNNPGLAKLAEYLATFCEIKLENYPSAISWFEGIVQNPETIEDSIFAIIDLGYTYFLMENGGLKSSYTGSFSQYKFETKKQFDSERDYLLSLLYKDVMSDTDQKSPFTESDGGQVKQNAPNPFSDKTTIWYNLHNESTVQLKIYDYTGQLIRTLNEGSKAKGAHYVEFDASGLKTGVYFYSILINGKTTDTRKMAIMR